MDEAVAALDHAAQLDLDDHLRFILRSREDRVDGRGSTRVKFDVHLGGRQLPNGVSVDVVVDRYPLGEVTRKQLEPSAPLEWPAGYPVVALYPVVDHVADKVCAMYEKHGATGIVSTRYRDLVDLVLIALREQLDGAQIHTVLRIEVARRTALGTLLRLPPTFTVPGPSWPEGYRASAANVAGLQNYRTIEQAAELAHGFLDPLLANEAPPTTWDPARLRWQ